MHQTLQELVDQYKISDETSMLVQSTPIVLLVGVSGAGKDTIKHKLLDSGKYHHIVSHTTRPARENAGVMETDGVDYHFITEAMAINMLASGAFVEANQYTGNIYGTSADEIKRAKAENKIAITDLEVQGVAEYKAISDKVIAVFILPPNFAEWQRRLLMRYGTDGVDPADLQKRMNTAIAELKEALARPYYHFITNEDLAESVATVDKIAHGHNTFNEKDAAARQRAVQLLNDLTNHI